MITLYQFPPVWGLPNGSPFCMKVETYLRMAGLPYQFARGADIRKAPKGKFPVIEDNGKIIPDSSFIVEYLKATYGDPLDGRLTPAEQAVALAMRRLMEENLYWCALYSRWGEDENWRITREAYFGFMPAIIRPLIAGLIRRQTLKSCYGHGMGRHTRDEIYHIGKTDISALAAFLADKLFFMGEQPSSLDATAYAFLANLLWTPIHSPLSEHAATLPNLAAYCERMKARYWA
jgi:glutathione S-transferase